VTLSLSHLFSLSGQITVKATRRNAGGQIVDKGAYCCFCGKYVCRLVRHLQDCHTSETEVARLMLLTDPEEKKAAALVLRNQGNWKHNCSVLSAGHGEMIVARAPADVSTFNHKDYVPCDLCFGYFKETEMYRHNCPKADSGIRPRLKAGKVIRQIQETGMTKGMATILVGLQDDAIGRVAKTDELLLSWLHFQCTTGFWMQSKWKSQTRAKMRLGARLLLELQKTFPDVSLREVLVKKNFDAITEAVKSCSLSSEGTESLQVPLKLGHLINSLLQRMLSQASKASDDETCKAVQDFQELMKSDWPVSVTTACHFAIKEKRRNEVPCIPSTEDTIRFATHCKTKLESALQAFEQSPDTANYRNLQKATLARMAQFNRRRGGEVSEVKVVDFIRAMERSASTTDEIFKSLSPEEQAAARSHKLLVVNGKCNRNNYIILDSAMESGLELLIRHRGMAEIDPANQFIFAIPRTKASTLNASKIRAEFAAEADVQNMVARGMRKYIATTLQVIWIDGLVRGAGIGGGVES
jgi:hypothetical protein